MPGCPDRRSEMKIRTILILIAMISFGLGIQAKETSCEICHGKLRGRLSQPVTQWKNSIHQQNGINCANCHGGNPDARNMKAAHSRAKRWIGKPGPIQIVKLCGTCHANEPFMKKYNPNARTDQLKNYLTSNHGINIMKKKDGRAATCASCHGAHDILKAMNPRSHVYPENVVQTCAKCHADKKLMANFDISGEEVADYKSSVHANALYKKHDLSAPTCNDCHGNHGAAPPGAASVEKVCGTCHVMNQKLFDESPHKEWDEIGLRGCVECHSNHAIHPPTDVMLSTDKGVCLNCHDSSEPAFKTMQAMHKTLTGLETKLAETRTMVDSAAEKGMLMDDAKLDLQDAKTAYIKSRTAVHKFSSTYLDKVAKSALVDITKVQKLAKERLLEVTKRRSSFYWFGGLFFILLILLGLKIRSMEK
jgi:predicted CXXCH cytochrome family protein